MKMLIIAAVLVLVGFSGFQAIAGVAPTTGFANDTIISHGGGCRKSSPPGMCCHKNHKTGQVHCH